MRKSLQFFAATFAVRVAHALASLDFHVDGDVAVPWLMANDWERTLHHRFYWGQDYLGTYETFLLSKLGHLFFATIPLAFTVIAGQLEVALGVTLLFAAVRKLRPGFGERWGELALAVALLGFLPPALEKFSFGPGMGFSLAPLATGLAIWLWAGIAAAAPRARAFAGAGIAYGLMLTSSRLCAVPCLALLLCLALARESRRGLALGAGIAAGLAPELALGLERSAHHTIAFAPLVERWHNFANALGQTGIALGILPIAVREPEDTLWVRGHAPMTPHPIVDAAAMLAFLALAWVTRRKLRARPGWIFAAIAGVNFALIALDGISVDQAAARRYSMALAIALSAWLLVNWDLFLSRAFAVLRLGMLAVYLVASVSYASPFGETGEILKAGGFRDGDCLSGHGGDLTAAMAFSNQVVDVIAQGWRLPGNYSRAVESCRGRIFAVSTGAVPSPSGCERIYAEPTIPAFRPPIAVYRCEGSSPQAIPERTRNNSP